jgi:hypothetical protein
MINEIHEILNQLTDEESALKIADQLNNIALILLLNACDQVRMERIMAAETCKRDFEPIKGRRDDEP